MGTQLMEGITVLSQNLNYTERIFGFIFTPVVVCLFIFGIIFFCSSIKDKVYPVSILLGTFLIICGLVLFGTISSVFAKPTTQYKVTVSEEVKLKEFDEKYEIIDRDGETYTIVEKEFCYENSN